MTPIRTRITLLSVLVLSGCATVHFGRLQPVIPAEREAYDCKQIALEIAKCDAFLTQLSGGWSDAKGRRFFGFLGDLGVGNHNEYYDAKDSAINRREGLVDLAAKKNCPAPPAAPQID